MDGNFLAERMTLFIPLLLSLTVHEWAHAMAAWKLGDDTASMMGRLTLNPIPHIDPIGTLLLPLIGIPFGWAKPVPVNPTRFTRKFSMSTGMIITAVAGPASNVVLAVLCAIAYGIMLRFFPEQLTETPAIQGFLSVGMYLNVILAVFNLLPIPPLDGSRVVDGLMPYEWRPQWERLTNYAPWALGAVIVLPFVVGISIFAWPSAIAHRLLMGLAIWIAG